MANSLDTVNIITITILFCFRIYLKKLKDFKTLSCFTDMCLKMMLSIIAQWLNHHNAESQCFDSGEIIRRTLSVNLWITLVIKEKKLIKVSEKHILNNILQYQPGIVALSWGKHNSCATSR